MEVWVAQNVQGSPSLPLPASVQAFKVPECVCSVMSQPCLVLGGRVGGPLWLPSGVPPPLELSSSPGKLPSGPPPPPQGELTSSVEESDLKLWAP